MAPYYSNITASLATYMDASSFSTSPQKERTMRKEIDKDTGFRIIIEQDETERPGSSCAYDWAIFHIEDEDEDRHYKMGYAKTREDAEIQARKKIKELMKPYKPKPKLMNFAPPIVKRVTTM